MKMMSGNSNTEQGNDSVIIWVGGALVVLLTLNPYTPGYSFIKRVILVLFPTPLGPATTTGRGRTPFS